MRSFLSICCWVNGLILILLVIANNCEANDGYHKTKTKRYYGTNCSKCHQSKKIVKQQVVEQTTVVNNLLIPQILMPLMFQEPVKVPEKIRFEPTEFKNNFPLLRKAQPYKSPFVSQQIVNVNSGYFIQNQVIITSKKSYPSQQKIECHNGSCNIKQFSNAVEPTHNQINFGYKTEVLDSIKNLK
tara:strand:+ start:6184 stop:6738 length:555 start_codon:yes stop_codon:yes gene_type:complete